MKKALILGITGQDGSYLADLLLSHGYEVHGMVRHTSHNNLKRIGHLIGEVTLHQGDMLDPLSVDRILRAVQPHEVYNEADQDNVDFSYKAPSYTADITYGAVANLLESVLRFDPTIKVFQPVSATMFGLSPHPQNEQTEFQPQSPYACAKLATYYLCQHYRREHGLHVSTGILYNHDSPRRSDKYLLHRIVKQAVRVFRDEQEYMTLPVLDMQVDIGYAKEYMKVACEMLQQEQPDDYVVATGWGVTIRELAETALGAAGVPAYKFEEIIQLDESLRRVGEQPTLIGDPSKMRQRLGSFLFCNALGMVEMLTTLEMEKSCG